MAALQSRPLAKIVRRQSGLKHLNVPVPSVAFSRGPAMGFLLPSLPVTISVLLALLLQRLIAAIYADFIAGLIEGSRSQHTAGAEVLISYLCTAVTTLATAWYCRTHSGPSRVLLVLHLIAVIIPMQALVVAQFEFARPEFAVAVAFAFLCVVLLVGTSPELTMKQPGVLARVSVILLCTLLSLYVYGALFASGGLARLNERDLRVERADQVREAADARGEAVFARLDRAQLRVQLTEVRVGCRRHRYRGKAQRRGNNGRAGDHPGRDRAPSGVHMRLPTGLAVGLARRRRYTVIRPRFAPGNSGPPLFRCSAENSAWAPYQDLTRGRPSCLCSLGLEGRRPNALDP